MTSRTYHCPRCNGWLEECDAGHWSCDVCDYVWHDDIDNVEEPDTKSEK